jgi:hypothetical protein
MSADSPSKSIPPPNKISLAVPVAILAPVKARLAHFFPFFNALPPGKKSVPISKAVSRPPRMAEPNLFHHDIFFKIYIFVNFAFFFFFFF